jgi:hypothetical protein
MKQKTAEKDILMTAKGEREEEEAPWVKTEKKADQELVWSQATVEMWLLTLRPPFLLPRPRTPLLSAPSASPKSFGVQERLHAETKGVQ